MNRSRSTPESPAKGPSHPRLKIVLWSVPFALLLTAGTLYLRSYSLTLPFMPALESAVLTAGLLLCGVLLRVFIDTERRSMLWYCAGMLAFAFSRAAALFTSQPAAISLIFPAVTLPAVLLDRGTAVRPAAVLTAASAAALIFAALIGFAVHLYPLPPWSGFIIPILLLFTLTAGFIKPRGPIYAVVTLFFLFSSLYPMLGYEGGGQILVLAALALSLDIALRRDDEATSAEERLKRALEQRLAESENRMQFYRRFVEGRAAGMIILDEGGRTVYANELAASRLGLSRSQLLEKPLIERVKAEQREIWSLEEQKWRAGSGGSFEIEMGSARGRSALLWISAEPVRDRLHRYRGCRLVLLEGKQAHHQWRQRSRSLESELAGQRRALQDSQVKYQRSLAYHRSLLAAVTEWIVVLDLEGRPRYLNPAAVSAIGYQAEDLPPSRLPAFHSDLESLRRSLGRRAKVELRDVEAEIRTRRGRRLWGLWNVCYLLDEKGERSGILCVGRDITDLVELRRNLSRLQKQVDGQELEQTATLRDRLNVLLDLELDSGRVLSRICQASRRAGWRQVLITEWVQGSEITRVLASAGIRAASLRAFVAQRNALFINPLPFLDEAGRLGEAFRVSASSSDAPRAAAFDGSAWEEDDVLLLPLRSAAGIHGFLTLFAPVTHGMPDAGQVSWLAALARRGTRELERKKSTARLEKAGRDLRRMTGVYNALAHDIRTPLSSILTLTDILRRGYTGPLNEEQAKQMEIIADSGDNLLRMINDRLDFSRLDAGVISTTPTAFSPARAFQERIEMIRPLSRGKNLQLDVRVSSSVPGSVFADRDKFERVLTNLLSNSVKYSEKGKITARLGWSAKSSELRIRISDSGRGMTPQELERAFEPFQSSATKEGGTGLGLTIARQMWILMGGGFSVKSARGRGTTFTLSLPVRLLQERAPRRKRPAVRSLSGRSVLLVDDEQHSRYALEIILKEMGMKVRTAAGGSGALAQARRRTPDIILMDMMMPGMDGYETAAKMRAAAALKKVPIIAMTARSASEDEGRALASGCSDYLHKPFKVENLRQKIAQWLEGKG